jgi:hypothetical protein
MEWSAAVIAFDSSEIAPNPNIFRGGGFPEEWSSNRDTVRLAWTDRRTSQVSPIRGLLHLFSGFSLYYHDRAIEHEIWLVEASASAPLLTAPDQAETDRGLLLGTTFADRLTAAEYDVEEVRIVGYLL